MLNSPGTRKYMMIKALNEMGINNKPFYPKIVVVYK
jgi:hypothetical protein